MQSQLINQKSLQRESIPALSTTYLWTAIVKRALLEHDIMKVISFLCYYLIKKHYISQVSEYYLLRHQGMNSSSRHPKFLLQTFIPYQTKHLFVKTSIPYNVYEALQDVSVFLWTEMKTFFELNSLQFIDQSFIPLPLKH